MKKYILIFIITFFGCKKEAEDLLHIHNLETYTIKEGYHNSVERIWLFHKTELRFLAQFDNSAIYTSKYPINQYDINKLYGFSDCSSLHHQNSARFGWNWQNNKLNIYAYCYENSHIYSEFIKSIEINKIYEFKIDCTENSYIFYIDGVELTTIRKCSKGGIRYYLFPYFGGDETATHEIKIKIKEL